jgi:hypothetical protein
MLDPIYLLLSKIAEIQHEPNYSYALRGAARLTLESAIDHLYCASLGMNTTEPTFGGSIMFLEYWMKKGGANGITNQNPC